MQNKLGYLVLNKTPLIMFFYQCNIGQAVRGEIEYISNSKPIIMLLGPGCSKAAMPVAESVHHWNVVQVFQFLFVPNKTIERREGDYVIPLSFVALQLAVPKKMATVHFNTIPCESTQPIGTKKAMYLIPAKRLLVSA